MKSVQLVGRQQLVIEHREADDTLQLYGSDGRLTLTLRITPDGPVLLVEGADLAIRATGALAIDAQRVAIRGRDGVVLHSDGDTCVSAAGSLELTAERQQLRATRGDVSVYANDDVVLDGERVRMNC
jgi:hypothetical protein